MTVLASTILDRAGQSVGEGLPRVVAAVVLLILGVLIARLVARLLGRGLQAAGLDDFAERSGVHDSLERFGLERSLSRAIATAVRLALTVVVILAGVSLLGLGFLQESINQAVLFLPKLLVAVGLLLAGAVIGTFAHDRAQRLGEQMDLPGPVGRIAELVIFAVFGVTALAQIGVSTIILTALVGIVIAGAVLAFTLAFGLGGREVARQVSAGRVVRATYEPGQTITVSGIRGEVVVVESSSTLLRTLAGTEVRVPNQVLLESVVETHDS